jgi:diadenosine tetraphosphate (Ap4A) HIT family hydrolase
VYLNRDQKHKGRCIVAYKEHKTEYFQLSPEQNAGFFKDVADTARAIQNVFQPDKINYATFGDLFPHAHVHVVPKYSGKLQWGEAFHDDVPKELLSDPEYQELIKKIKTELDKLVR